MKESGAYVSEVLAKDGRTLRHPEKGLQASDEPYIESKEIIVGFNLVEASDYEHAVELARPSFGR